jgi:hypothetical protein
MKLNGYSSNVRVSKQATWATRLRAAILVRGVTITLSIAGGVFAAGAGPALAFWSVSPVVGWAVQKSARSGASTWGGRSARVTS